MALVLGKKYTFNMPSTTKVEVSRTVEHYIQFYEDRMVYVGHYLAKYIGEEDEETAYKKDVDREHQWIDVIRRQSICRVHMYRWFDEELWAVKFFCTGVEDIILCFYKEETAKRIFDLAMEYIFGVKPDEK